MRAYTIDQVAEQWQLSTKTIRRLIDTNQLEAFRIGGSIRISEAAMRKAMGLNA